MRYCRLILILAIVILAGTFMLICTRFPMLLVFVAGGFILRSMRKTSALTAFGTARWADAYDAEDASMFSQSSALPLGRMQVLRPAVAASFKALFDRHVPAAKACERFIFSMRKLQPAPPPQLVHLANAVHVAVFAPTGVGKGVSCVIPHLMSCPDSMVVVDFKGENAKLTAAHRRREFGHRTILLDPYHVVTKAPDQFNPVDKISADSSLAIDYCRDLAEALVIRTGQEKEPHWADSAETWIAAMAAVITQFAEKKDRSLQTLRTMLTNPVKMQAVIKLMCESDVCGGMLARLGYQLTHFKDKELASVLTTTNRFLRFLDTLSVAECTRTSSFDPDDLCKGKMTVYLILPPEHMRAQSGLLRMWISSLLRAVVRGGLQDDNKVHFVLDEAASLGHMACLEDAVDKYRGYGVRLQFYYQSLGQLQKCWPEGQEQTLLSNTSQVFFGVNDQQTAEYVSARLGEATIIVQSGGTSRGGSLQYGNATSPESQSTSWNENFNWAQQGRKLLKPEEVVALPARTAITFTPGIPPLRTTLLRYYEEPALGIAVSRWKVMRLQADIWLTACAMLILSSLLAIQIATILFA